MIHRSFLLLLFVCIHTIGFSQDNPTIKNLTFEGAGIRGIAYCGAIQELESRNLMGNIEKIGGTSSGAIMALALSLGYSGKEVEKIIGATNFKKLNDGKFFFIGGFNRVFKYFGWYRGRKIEKWLGKIIEAKTGAADITFEELHQRGFKDLYVAGTCLNRQKEIIFSCKTCPKMKIKDAVRISTSIPVYFEAVFIDSTGNVYKHPKQKKGLDVMVDGGFLENYPIHIFGPDRNDNLHTLGFRIDPDPQIKNDQGAQILAEMSINNMKEYVNAFYTIVIENLNRQKLTTEDWSRTISISDGNIPPRLRKLKKEEIQTLIENGRNATQHYLSKK